ncbi:MAG: carboxymuconolactone decarboxylase family protein [Phycisphaerae bacterium]
MAWIDIVEEKDAQGVLAQVYEAAVKRAGRLYNILKIQSQSPAALKACMELYAAVMRSESPLTRRQREMLAVVVSKTNGCRY